MSDISDFVAVTCREADERFPDDADAAVAYAAQQITQHERYNELVSHLFRSAVLAAVHDARHWRNRQMKRERGLYGPPAKVTVVDNPVVARAKQSIYAYRLGGMQIGDLTGDRLDSIHNQEEAAARGHLFHVKLIEWLRRNGVTGDVRVRDVISESKLESNFDRIHRKVHQDAAPLV